MTAWTSPPTNSHTPSPSPTTTSPSRVASTPSPRCRCGTSIQISACGCKCWTTSRRMTTGPATWGGSLCPPRCKGGGESCMGCCVFALWGGGDVTAASVYGGRRISPVLSTNPLPAASTVYFNQWLEFPVKTCFIPQVHRPPAHPPTHTSGMPLKPRPLPPKGGG
jgi:hypothetical protein